MHRGILLITGGIALFAAGVLFTSSRDAFGIVTVTPYEADVNKDAKVNAIDLMQVAQKYGMPVPSATATAAAPHETRIDIPTDFYYEMSPAGWEDLPRGPNSPSSTLVAVDSTSYPLNATFRLQVLTARQSPALHCFRLVSRIDVYSAGTPVLGSESCVDTPYSTNPGYVFPPQVFTSGAMELEPGTQFLALQYRFQTGTGCGGCTINYFELGAATILVQWQH